MSKTNENDTGNTEKPGTHCLDGPLLPTTNPSEDETNDLPRGNQGQKQYPIPLHYDGPGENPYITPID
jgi:hypothetical protein